MSSFASTSGVQAAGSFNDLSIEARLNEVRRVLEQFLENCSEECSENYSDDEAMENSADVGRACKSSTTGRSSAAESELNSDSGTDTPFCSCRSSATSSCGDYPMDRDRSMDIFYNVAPPPQALPVPEWREREEENIVRPQLPEPSADFKIWVQASIPDQANGEVKLPERVDCFNWPAFPGSVWSRETPRQTLEREASLRRNGNGTVEAFFRRFGRNQPIPSS